MHVAPESSFEVREGLFRTLDKGRRGGRRLVALVFCLYLASCTDQPDDPPSSRPKHVILISLDTTRADRLAPWGGRKELTPELLRLAGESVVFTDASSPAPTTLAAHASLMTGRSPRSHGTPRNGFVVNPDNVTLAELLGEAGHQTLGVIGSFALESLFGLDQGFARYDEEFGIEYQPGLYDQNQRRASDVTTRALEMIDAELGVDGDRGLFVFAHYFDPHAPYDPPEWALRDVGLEANSRADLKDLGRAVMDQQGAAGGAKVGQRWVFSNGLRSEFLDGAKGSPSETGLRLAKLYEAEVRSLDREIGRLLSGLAERGILNDSLLVLTGDHGETFWEHGDFWNHGLGVYQTTLHVPLLFRLPGGAKGGTVINEPVSTLDVFPSVCGFMGLTSNPDVEGVDLWPLFEGAAIPSRVLISEATQPVGDIEVDRVWRNSYKAKSVRQGSWKYILTPYLGNREELYDLSVDPGEKDNLLQGQDVGAIEKAAWLRGCLDAWTARISPLKSDFNEAQSQAVLQRLKALGYAGQDD